MSHRTIYTAGGMVHVYTGSEGPSHDPYSSVEVVDERHPATRKSVLYHGGLGEYVEVDGRVVYHGDAAGRVFQKLTGFHPAEWEDFMSQARSRCKCGCRRFEWREGYPGELLKLCVRCGNVCDYSFDESAIM